MKTVNDDQRGSEAAIDLSHAPLGVRAASRLVDAVAASDDRVERHYLEVKSDLDLTWKNDIAKIAKFVLGAANRMPSTAANAFEGYAVMIIGVAPGAIRGVPPIEILEIDKIVGQYLGVAGPRWDIVRVPVKGSNNEVLVILVDPPKDGQDPFLCRKEGDSLYNGRVYIRADGETREAKAEELDQLLERGRFQEIPDIAFEVDIVGHAHPIGLDETQTLETYLQKVRTRLLDALPKPVEPKKASANSRFLDQDLTSAVKTAAQMQDIIKGVRAAALLGSTPESRTESQYRAKVDAWEIEFREAWPAAVDIAASWALDGMSIRVKNDTKIFFHEVEVKIHLEGDIRGIGWKDKTEPIRVDELDLPSPPRAWGPTQTSPFNASILNQGIFHPPGNYSTYRSPLDWNNSGSVDFTLKVGELRPRQTHTSDDDEVILVLPFNSVEPIRGTWEITARDHNEIYAGELELVVAQPLDLTTAFSKLLKL